MRATTTYYRHTADCLLYRVTDTPGRRPTDARILTMQRRRDVANGPTMPETAWGQEITISHQQLHTLLAYHFTPQCPETEPPPC